MMTIMMKMIMMIMMMKLMMKMKMKIKRNQENSSRPNFREQNSRTRNLHWKQRFPTKSSDSPAAETGAVPSTFFSSSHHPPFPRKPRPFFFLPFPQTARIYLLKLRPIFNSAKEKHPQDS
jgi:hypothetical protein